MFDWWIHQLTNAHSVVCFVPVFMFVKNKKTLPDAWASYWCRSQGHRPISFFNDSLRKRIKGEERREGEKRGVKKRKQGHERVKGGKRGDKDVAINKKRREA